MNLDDFLWNSMWGAASGALARTILHPFDRVKLLLQVQSSAMAPKRNLTKFLSSQARLMSTIFREEGLLGFSRGAFSSVFRYAPLQALNLAFKDGLKPLFPQYSQNSEFHKFFLTQMACGGLAGALSQVLLHPQHHYITHKSHMVHQATEGTYSSPSDFLRKASSIKGLSRIYEGFGIVTLGVIIFRACLFGIYDSLRTKTPFYNQDRFSFLGFASRLLLANLATVIAHTVSNPIDNIRRRLMQERLAPEISNLIQQARSIGAKNLFANFWSWRSTIPMTLTLVFYDEFQRAFSAP